MRTPAKVYWILTAIICMLLVFGIIKSKQQSELYAESVQAYNTQVDAFLNGMLDIHES